MEALTYSTVAVTLGLVVARPRLGARFQLSPSMAAMAGVLVLAACGSVGFADLAWAATTMWRPLLAVVAIMVMTGVARRLGVLDGLAERVFRAAGSSRSRLFGLVFGFGALTAALLNNDSGILLLTPLVIDAAKKRHVELVVPMAFAVFLSAGIAPLVVSNPMNMVVASYAGIGFNEYALRMTAPAVVGSVVTFFAVRWTFRGVLAKASDAPRITNPPRSARLTKMQFVTVAALALVVCSYPVVSLFGGPVWVVATGGAVVLLALARAAGERPTSILRDEVHLDTLLFLVAVLVMSIGLRNVGVVARLARVYDGASPLRIGMLSALGSAVLNNHPMSHLNMFALGESRADHARVLAALIGGDLGPRLFPMGSLAGLLWLEMVRRAGVRVPVSKFLVVGFVAAIPALVTSLLVLR